jgi:hypothetical protein
MSHGEGKGERVEEGEREGRMRREEEGGKREEGRGKREEGGGKREEGGGRREERREEGEAYHWHNCNPC